MRNKFSVVFLGSHSVGKTSIISEIINQEPATDDSLQAVPNLFVLPDKDVTIYDTKDISELSFDFDTSNFLIFFFVFNVNDAKSFEAIEQNMEKFKGQNILNILIGNKSDLECTVDQKKIKDLQNHGMKYLEVSAKTKVGIDEIIKIIQKKELNVKFYSQFFIKGMQPDFDYDGFKDFISQFTHTLNCTENNSFCPNLIMLSFKDQQTKEFVLMKVQEFSKKPILESNIIPIQFNTKDIDLCNIIYFVNIFDNIEVFKKFLASFDCNNSDIDDLFEVQQTNNPLVFTASIRKKSFAEFIYTFMPYIKFQNKPIIFSTSSIELPIITILNLPYDFLESELQFFKCNIKQICMKFHGETETTKKLSILFANNEDANEAIKYFNGARVDENEILAQHFVDKDMYREMSEYEIIVKKMVGSSFDLYHYFKSYGKIHHAEVKNKTSNGTVGKVQFYDKNDAINAISSLKQKGTRLEIGFSSEFSVHAFNLHPSITEKDIRKIFKGASSIWIKKSCNFSLPYAIISFNTINEAQYASSLSPIFKCLKIYCFYNMKIEQSLKKYNMMKNEILSQGNTLLIKGSSKFTIKDIINMICHLDDSFSFVLTYLFKENDFYISFEQSEQCETIYEQINNKLNESNISAEFISSY